MKQNRLFITLVIIALAISTIGTTCSSLGFYSYIMSKTNSAFNTGIITIFFLLTGIFFSPFLGLFANNFGLFKTISIPEFISAILLILVVVFNNIYFIYLVAFFLGINTRLVGISRMSLLPKIVEHDDLVKTNMFLRATNRLALVIGASMYGVFITFSTDLIFYFDAVTYIISGILLLSLRFFINSNEIPRAQKKKQMQLSKEIQNVFKALKSGFKILYQDEKINFIVIEGIVIRIFFIALPVLLLVFIKKELLLPDNNFGFLQTVSHIISCITFLLFAKVLPTIIKNHQIKFIFINFILFGILLSFISVLENMLSLYIVFCLAELFFFSAIVVVHSYVQQTIPSDKLPVAIGAVGPGFSIAAIISISLFTRLADIYSSRILFVVIGLGIVVSTTIVSLVLIISSKNILSINKETTEIDATEISN